MNVDEAKAIVELDNEISRLRDLLNASNRERDELRRRLADVDYGLFGGGMVPAGRPCTHRDGRVITEVIATADKVVRQLEIDNAALREENEGLRGMLGLDKPETKGLE